MTNKEKYKELCEEVEMPIFMQYWWLESVSAGKDWDVLLAYDELEPETILAALPYETGKRLWKHYVAQQEMSPYMGIWFAESIRQHPEQINAICEDFHQQLAGLKLSSFHQRFACESPAPQVLNGLGYQTVERRTYVLEDLQDLDKVIAGFSRNKRKKLEKLTLTYKVQDLEPEEFFRFHTATCSQKKRSVNYTREMLLVLYEKTQERNQGTMFGVYSADKALLAEAFLVWDKTTAYMLLNTFDHDYPDNGARELLTLEAIRRTRDLGLCLDFTYHRDYLKHYGAKRHTYSTVYWGTKTSHWITRIKEWLNG